MGPLEGADFVSEVGNLVRSTETREGATLVGMEEA